MKCQFSKTCPFFKGGSQGVAGKPIIKETLVNFFCSRSSERCARNILRERELEIPDDLLPNQLDRAGNLIRKVGAEFTGGSEEWKRLLGPGVAIHR